MKFTSVSYSYLCFLLLVVTANGVQQDSPSSLRGGGSSSTTTITSQEDKVGMDVPPLDQNDLSSMKNTTLTNETLDMSLEDNDENVTAGQEELFEGDIIPDYDMIMTRYGPELAKELESEGMIEAPSGGLSLQNLDTRKLWTRRVNDIVEVPYTFTNQFSSSHRATIDSALKSLGDSAKVIKFVRRTSQSDYVLIQSGTGCSSSVGKKRGKQNMSLKIPSCVGKGVIQHEFMHAIGILHEQSRPDRDNFVTINTQNIKAGREDNFRRADRTKLLGNPYDYKSVMHYPKNLFSKNGRDTITTKNGASIGQTKGADFQDILDIRLMYQCTSGPRTLSQYNSNRCTSNCKCWKDEVGCNGNNNACQGSLVCSSNKCVNPGSGPTPTTPTAPTPTAPTPTAPAPTPTPPTSAYMSAR